MYRGTDTPLRCDLKSLLGGREGYVPGAHEAFRCQGMAALGGLEGADLDIDLEGMYKGARH